MPHDRRPAAARSSHQSHAAPFSLPRETSPPRVASRSIQPRGEWCVPNVERELERPLVAASCRRGIVGPTFVHPTHHLETLRLPDPIPGAREVPECLGEKGFRRVEVSERHERFRLILDRGEEDVERVQPAGQAHGFIANLERPLGVAAIERRLCRVAQRHRQPNFIVGGPERFDRGAEITVGLVEVAPFRRAASEVLQRDPPDPSGSRSLEGGEPQGVSFLIPALMLERADLDVHCLGGEVVGCYVVGG